MLRRNPEEINDNIELIKETIDFFIPFIQEEIKKINKENNKPGIKGTYQESSSAYLSFLKTDLSDLKEELIGVYAEQAKANNEAMINYVENYLAKLKELKEHIKFSPQDQYEEKLQECIQNVLQAADVSTKTPTVGEQRWCILAAIVGGITGGILYALAGAIFGAGIVALAVFVMGGPIAGPILLGPEMLLPMLITGIIGAVAGFVSGTYFHACNSYRLAKTAFVPETTIQNLSHILFDEKATGLRQSKEDLFSFRWKRRSDYTDFYAFFSKIGKELPCSEMKQNPNFGKDQSLVLKA